MQFTEAELARRIERVRILLGTHDEIYDDLSRGERAYKAEFTTRQRRLRCGVCGGPGCARCERGRVTVTERDPYDTGHDGVFDPSARTRLEQSARIDAQIERLQELELVRAGELAASFDFEQHLESAEARDHRGSYRDLRVTIDRMPRLLRGDEAVRWVASHMTSRRIRVPYADEQRLLEGLMPAVEELRDQGVGTRQIAEGLGVRRSDVRDVLAMLRAKP